ncbi:MAG TPA: hypothetical protein VFW16_15240 [Streptosporangiaceae bacterium]|nr:hypothetical protein [Streptosporangiaceae bacterium]
MNIHSGSRGDLERSRHPRPARPDRRRDRANGGLGLETGRQLAAKGAHVVMAVRNQKKAAAAVDEIRTSVSLTALLLPALLRTPGARIVTVTSTAHHMGRAINPANPHLHGRYRPWRAYGQAKLANFHFGLGLQRELENADATTASLIAHPGLSNTDLQAVSVQQTGGGMSQQFFLFLARRSGMSAADGALSQLRAATDPAAKGGEFYGPRFVNSGPPVRKPVVRRLGMDKAIAALWEVSERETGIAIDVHAAAAA